MTIDDLPEELMGDILSHLDDGRDRSYARLVCRSWARICPPPTCQAHPYLTHPKKRDAGGHLTVFPFVIGRGWDLHVEMGDHIYYCSKGNVMIRSRPRDEKPYLPLLFVSPTSGLFTITTQ